MSGGSYNYLCHAMRDGSLSRYETEMRQMAKRLRELGHADAARDTEGVLTLLDAAESMAAALEDVWQTVEWLDSNDSGEDEVTEAVTAYKPYESVKIKDGDSTRDKAAEALKAGVIVCCVLVIIFTAMALVAQYTHTAW